MLEIHSWHFASSSLVVQSYYWNSVSHHYVVISASFRHSQRMIRTTIVRYQQCYLSCFLNKRRDFNCLQYDWYNYLYAFVNTFISRLHLSKFFKMNDWSRCIFMVILFYKNVNPLKSCTLSFSLCSHKHQLPLWTAYTLDHWFKRQVKKRLKRNRFGWRVIWNEWWLGRMIFILKKLHIDTIHAFDTKVSSLSSKTLQNISFPQQPIHICCLC